MWDVHTSYRRQKVMSLICEVKRLRIQCTYTVCQIKVLYFMEISFMTLRSKGMKLPRSPIVMVNVCYWLWNNDRSVCSDNNLPYCCDIICISCKKKKNPGNKRCKFLLIPRTTFILPHGSYNTENNINWIWVILLNIIFGRWYIILRLYKGILYILIWFSRSNLFI